MAEYPHAQEIWLKKIKKITPKFHQHIAASKLRKEPCKVGDEVAGYTVTKTDPNGTVLAHEQTTFHYE